MNSSPGYFSRNNFDLIRLVAAGQVLIVHGLAHMHVAVLKPLSYALAAFPGVPTFFFVSGFLISAAWERNPDVRVFYGNRIRRIYPGLWVCVSLATAVVLVFALVQGRELPWRALLLWMAAQGSVLQVWNPDFLRWFGVGAVNGSLWTIPVEIAFYLVLPLLYGIAGKRLRLEPLLVLIAIVSFTVLYGLLFWHAQAGTEDFLRKLLRSSPAGWMGMFCLGTLAQRYIHRLYPLVAGRFVPFLALFLVMAALGGMLGTPVLFGGGNGIGIVNYLSLCLLVLAAAYSGRGLSDRLLKRNDLSYGTYIYHMPVFNTLIALGITGLAGFGIGIASALSLAALSWWLIEKPILRRRQASLYAR